MPNKEVPAVRSGVEVKQVAVPQNAVVAKLPSAAAAKVVTTKVIKDAAMSPTGAISDSERTELLGSLTTLQQQRTSARVIKKLKLEPPPEKRSKRPDGQPDDLTECDTPNKLEQELKFPTVKQRMPKALWSTDEKNFFFEALNEYGKDFDAITAYICAKAKKKGIPDANLKTKTQVSHFYYRTWHKLTKHVHFDENVKKVAQELYALINYGELRKKLVSVSEKTCARLSEMVRCGSLVVRVRGRNVRVRTPMCRALRRLNQIHERACGPRVCTRALISLRARTAAAWGRVQAAAHNPRTLLHAPLRARLQDLILALHNRWKICSYYKPEKTDDLKDIEDQKDEDIYPPDLRPCDDDERDDIDDLSLETDRLLSHDQILPRTLALHVGPRPDTTINLPVLTPSEQLSSQKICFSSYLQRMCSLRHKDASAKMRTTKRQRKDSASEKEKELEQKKMRLDDDPTKLMQIDETAVDGIDLMASYRNIQDEEEKPSTEDEKELKSEETAEEDLERDGYKEMCEREKDSFSEMEDDEKYNKSDTDNESDHGKKRDGEFKHLKVKFRIRPKKRGGSEYTLVSGGDKDDDVKIDEPAKDDDVKPDDVKGDDTKIDEAKDVDVDTAIRQIRRGWSIYDAGDLTIGDLYLMFGGRSRLELDYWWSEPTAPLPSTPHHSKTDSPTDRKTDKTPDKTDKPTEKGTDSSVEDCDKRESDTDILSPKNGFGQDSNDGLSGDERNREQLASPEHKSSVNSSLKLVSKLINRPLPLNPTSNAGLALMGDRLKRLLALAGNPHVPVCSGISRCECGHVCPQRKQHQKQLGVGNPLSRPEDPTSVVFRHPTPIAPKTNPDTSAEAPLNLSGVPRWRRGRPRGPSRRVVVQRLLPLMPKLPPPNNLIPVKIVPNTPPAPPKILPKPPPNANSDMSFFYVLSDSNGQFYFQDGDRSPIATLAAANGAEPHAEDQLEPKDELDSSDVKSDAVSCPSAIRDKCKGEKETEDTPAAGVTKTDITRSDIAQFLPTESMSLSPSRLLRDADCWPEGSVQDFSLSSFLGHLEARQPELQVDSQLQSLMAESSVDYVAKFADLAAEVAEVAQDDIPSNDLT